MDWRVHKAEEDVLLADLAKKYKVSEAELLAVNDWGSPVCRVGTCPAPRLENAENREGGARAD